MNVELPPGLDKFVAEKLKTGDYLDASEVIRDGLRLWKERDDLTKVDPAWLEQEIQEGLDSPDLPQSDSFWPELRSELHRDYQNR